MNVRLPGPPCLALILAMTLAACGQEELPEPQGPTPIPSPTPAADRPATVNPGTELGAAVRAAMAGDHRTAEHRNRDDQRNPEETLAFFELERRDRVIEIWPGSGWYTEILAPLLRDHGHLVVANVPASPGTDDPSRLSQAMLDKFAENPGVYGQVEVVPFSPPGHGSLGPAESADFVLLSRQFHNIAANGTAEVVLEAIFEVLRPGGVLAVIQHRLPEDRDFDPADLTGYVPEGYVLEAVQAVGFRLAGRSEINANPRDSADHEQGVWTLPPTFRGCDENDGELERGDCRVGHEETGESDRMTLRFVKP